jgi:protoporphyrinogen oxidase
LGRKVSVLRLELAELCEELRLTEQVLEAPHAAPRYILIDRKLVNVPLSPALLTSGLLNWNEVDVSSRYPGKTSPPETDESIAAFVRRKFSAQLLDRLVGPFISGIYG